ncbi:MAG: choice-of-anchor J domain-containing protein, partial [Bacteroidota bacterium]|nr:choice-of-anchor J domain-containing protein [Bacteroidota bacterium]
MKRIFTILLLSTSVFFTSSLKAQVIFLETFDNIPGPTGGAPGTLTFPAGWLLANVDNNTPSIPFITNAWVRSDNGAGDTVAVSTSYYTPPGQADDWMWTPAINVTAGNFTRLSWDAIATDSDFPDGYEVRIMTIPPSGSTGNIGNMLTASTQLLNIPAENAQWINRSVDISSYNGRTVYIGFRNHSYDDYLLAINNVKVEKLTSLPVLLISFTGIKTVAGNDLRWETSQQNGIQQYNIERSTDGTHFSTIGSVKANQETSFTYRFN